jgi:hypothetical protein
LIFNTYIIALFGGGLFGTTQVQSPFAGKMEKIDISFTGMALVLAIGRFIPGTRF